MAEQSSQASPPTERERNTDTNSSSTAAPTTDNNNNNNSSNNATDDDVAEESAPVVQTCSHCHVAGERPLKPCAKCQAAVYCSRDCQKAAWKRHKKTCAADAQVYAMTADLKPAAAPRLPKKEGHRGGLQKWQFDT